MAKVTRTLKLPSGKEVRAKVDSAWTKEEIKAKLVQSGAVDAAEFGAPAIPDPFVGTPPGLQPESSTQAAARAFGVKTLENLTQLPESFINNLILKPDTLAAAGVPNPARADFSPRQLLTPAQEDRLAQREQASPIATAVGEAGANILGVRAGRGPVNRTAALNQQALAKVTAGIDKSVRDQSATVVQRVLSSAKKSGLSTGRRALETGVEGAAIALLDDSDPVTVGAQGAAAQAGADALIAFGKAAAKRPGRALLISTMATLGIQQWTPGGLDRVLMTVEARNKEIAFAVLMGAAGALGLGKLPENFAGPGFREITNTVRKGALLSVLSSMAKDPQAATVVQRFSDDPNFFGETARRRIERALTEEDIDISNTINGLMKNREFRRKFDELNQ